MNYMKNLIKDKPEKIINKFIIFAFLVIILFFNINKTNSKYVIQIPKTAFILKNIDNEPPSIIGVPENEQGTKENVNVDYYDNSEIESAIIWYNNSEKNFVGSGENVERNTIYTDEGWYYIKITDIAGNITQRTWYIDKSNPSVEVRFYKKQ